MGSQSMSIPFVGGAYEGRTKSINAQQSINLFLVIDEDDGKVPTAMYGTPGLTTFSEPATTAIVRRMLVMGDYLYAVVGAVVYKITSTGSATSLGSITTSTGHVSMAGNGTQILVVDGTANGHIITTSALADITDADFIAATAAVFFDGYFIVTEADSGKIWISTLYDGTKWDALDFATAEAAPDDLIGIGTTRQNIWLFGKTSTEVYYNSGDPDFPFNRVPGAILDIGCDSIASMSEIEGRLYWLTDKFTVVRNNGLQYETISTPGIEYQISTYSTITDATGFWYTLAGRTFYVLTFPTADKTFVYGVNTGAWHEWQSLD